MDGPANRQHKEDTELSEDVESGFEHRSLHHLHVSSDPLTATDSTLRTRVLRLPRVPGAGVSRVTREAANRPATDTSEKRSTHGTQLQMQNEDYPPA